MPLKLDKGKELLKKTIQKDARHTDYERVCKIAKEYNAYVTGEDVGSLLRQFTPRESKELFDQRVSLTSLTTPDIANTLATPMFKVGRTTANTSITWSEKDKAANNQTDLAQVAKAFYGSSSVEKYLTYRMPTMDLTDPNSFIVVEFEGSFDPSKPVSESNKKVQPYPFEVNSKEAIDYEYVNNKLQYLTVLNSDANKYTMYLENESIVAFEVKKDDIEKVKANLGNAVYDIWYKNEDNKEDGIYIVQVFEHKAGVVPAKRVGTIQDETTRNRTCVPMIHPAKSYFEKAIKTVSEFDITNALHTFPKVFRYGNRCPGDMKNGIVCNEGKNLADDKPCTICKGSGWSNQTTTASEVIVAAPKDMKDMVSLEMMMTYKSPSIELLTFQKQLGLYDLKQLAIKAVYNGDTYVSDTVVATATAKNIDLESVYDTLKPFADTLSDMYMFIMTTIASYRDLSKGFSITHTFPKDFKMKPLSVLLLDFKAANDSGAPSYVKQSISHDIAEKVYVDQPLELLKLQTKEKFYPFNGKSENEVNNLMLSEFVSVFDKTLYSKFDSIFFEIEQEQESGVDFYKMEYKKQKEIITKKVEVYMVIVDKENEANRAVAFNASGSPLGAGGGAE